MRWAEAKRIEDKKRALREALAGRTPEDAAPLLGISPRHVYRLKKLLLDEADLTGLTSGQELTSRHHLTRLTGMTVLTGDTERQVETALGALTGTPEESLTSRHAMPTLGRRVHMGSMAVVAEKATEELKVQLPKRMKDWLERKALHRKQTGEARRFAVSPIVVELIEREMTREDEADAGPGEQEPER